MQMGVGWGGRTIGTVLPEGSCPKSQVTWEPGWDNKRDGTDVKTRGVTFGT